MAEITKEQFKVVGKNTKTMESISRPNIGYWQDAWRRIRKNKIAFFSLCLIGLYVLMAIFVPMFSKYDIATQSVAEMNQSFSKAHWFGTDSLGRDLWVRAWSGARVSLTIGFAASIINAIVGSIMGGISGFYGGKIDMVIQRVVDVLYGIPSLIVTILLMVVVGNGVHCLILAMCCVGWIGGCRFVRGEVLKLRESDFVSAAKILGAGYRNHCKTYFTEYHGTYHYKPDNGYSGSYFPGGIPELYRSGYQTTELQLGCTCKRRNRTAENSSVPGICTGIPDLYNNACAESSW